MSNIYDRIRTENITRYGTAVHIYAPRLLTDLYAERTHFIYELLQNAEDACERARRIEKKRFSVHFELYPDRLEMHHNGIPFDENDVRGICRLAEGTKTEDLSLIGKFGIGFKSVYAYTKSPEIYSGYKYFCIKNYVHPYSIPSRKDVREEETLFVIPFNHDEISQEMAFSEIENRLKDLRLRTLLFLRNIEEISWQVDSSFGRYLRIPALEKMGRWVTLVYEENGNTKNSEKWLIFEKTVSLNKKDQVRVEIAYLVVQDPKTGKEQIVPARYTHLVAFFPTERETHLKFLIQGPYQTTSARDNIRDSAWNRELIEETATLVTESLSKVKELNLLDVSYLTTLPIESEDFLEENPRFRPIYEKVRVKFLGEEALLPAYNGGYITAKQALLARGEGLRELLSTEQLSLLFNKKDAKWLDATITVDKKPTLRNYLMNALKIHEISPERFARAFTEDFIKEQSDEWVIKFYTFLVDQKALWTKRIYLSRKEGNLHSKPFIRLENNLTSGVEIFHIPPFDSEGKPHVYLPSEDKNINRHFLVVKQRIVEDRMALEFLKQLGLREPDGIAGLMDIILPKYQKKPIQVKEKENIRDFQWISNTLEKYPKDERREALLSKIKETPFLFANRNTASEKAYKKPVELYLGELYTGENLLEVFFKGNDSIWFLDKRYKDVIDISILKELGCATRIKIYCRRTNREGNIIIREEYGCHERGLDGFDPDCAIDGLKSALRHINISKALIIWERSKQFHKKIFGILEKATRKDYSNSTKEKRFSKMGELLIKYPWLPDTQGNFHKPKELLLSDLHDEFDKESDNAKRAAERLGFKPDIQSQLLDQLPPTKRECYELFDMLYQVMPEEIVKEVLEKLVEQKLGGSDESSPQEIAGAMRKSLESQISSQAITNKNKVWSGLSPAEEERIRKEYGKGFLERLKRSKIISQPRISKKTTTFTDIDPKQFLLAEYNGHCQICNIRLDLGSNKAPYFEIFRLVEKRAKKAWADMEFNILCLCPNCHALMKHGGKDLRNIWETAEKCSRHEIVPEEVDERMGDFYIINIQLAGKERELFYTPSHINKLVAAIFEQSREREKNHRDGQN